MLTLPESTVILPAWQFLVTAGLFLALLHRPSDLRPLRETFQKSGSQQVLPGPCRPSLGSCCPWLPLPCTLEGQVSIPVLIKGVEEALFPLVGRVAKSNSEKAVTQQGL